MKPYSDRRASLIAQMQAKGGGIAIIPVSYTHLRAHET